MARVLPERAIDSNRDLSCRGDDLRTGGRCRTDQGMERSSRQSGPDAGWNHSSHRRENPGRGRQAHGNSRVGQPVGTDRSGDAAIFQLGESASCDGGSWADANRISPADSGIAGLSADASDSAHAGLCATAPVCSADRPGFSGTAVYRATGPTATDSAGRAGKSDSATRAAADATNGRRRAGQPCSTADSAGTTTAAPTGAVRSTAATTAARAAVSATAGAAHAAVSATATAASTGAVRSAAATTAGHAAVSATAASATTTVRPAAQCPVRGIGGLRASAANEARRRGPVDPSVPRPLAARRYQLFRTTVRSASPGGERQPDVHPDRRRGVAGDPGVGNPGDPDEYGGGQNGRRISHHHKKGAVPGSGTSGRDRGRRPCGCGRVAQTTGAEPVSLNAGNQAPRKPAWPPPPDARLPLTGNLHFAEATSSSTPPRT